MTGSDLGAVAWPPVPIRTPRLLLRQTEARDRPAYVALQLSPDVRRYLGGPAHSPDELEELVPTVPGRRPGAFAVEHAGSMIGMVTLDRRDPARPGRVGASGADLEVSYTFLPSAWGQGLARESLEAALGWTATVLPGEPIVLCTQTANARSLRLARRLGFVEIERFEEFGAEQWFGVRKRRTPAD